MKSDVPVIEGAVPRSILQRQRVGTGVTAACLGAFAIYMMRSDLPAVTFTTVMSLALIWVLERQARLALRYGYALRVFEDRIEFADARPPRVIRFEQIDWLVDRESAKFAILMSGEEVALPHHADLNEAYRYLLTKTPGNFKIP